MQLLSLQHRIFPLDVVKKAGFQLKLSHRVECPQGRQTETPSTYIEFELSRIVERRGNQFAKLS